MKITAVLVIALIAVLIVVSSTYVIGKVSQWSQKRTTGTGTASSANPNAGIRDSSSTRTIQPNPSESSESIGDVPAEHSPFSNGAASNASSLSSLNNQGELKSVDNDTETGAILPPDGRIYTGGEAPYAYIPTFSQKGRPLPIVPLTPVG